MQRYSNKYKIDRLKTFEEFCFPKKYELQPQQGFVAEYVKDHPQSMLIYHDIGSGKTCAGIRIGETFKNSRTIYIVLPKSLENNFRGELRTQCADETYITKAQREKLKKLDPSDAKYQKIIDKSNKNIDKVYHIYSYNIFFAMLKRGEVNGNNAVLIIDEAHNVISRQGNYYKLLHDFVHHTEDMLLYLMTGTPIVDRADDIALIINLLRKDVQMPVGSAFDAMFFSTDQRVPRIRHRKTFMEYIRGYVSYYKGAPDYTYPKGTIYFVKCEMSEKQRIQYVKQDKDLENENVENEKDSFLLKKRLISNIVYPNGELNEKGYASLTEKHLQLRNVKNYSTKFPKILGKIEKTDGLVFVYSNFKEYGGVKAFADFLRVNGYLDYQEHGTGEKRYAKWSRDQSNQEKQTIREIFNNKTNEYGQYIKIIIGSPSIKEGISLLRVKQVHLIEPYWNMARMMQILGRAFRFCSHKDLIESKRKVDIFIYLAYHSSINLSVDQKIMLLALEKMMINNMFLKLIKETAIDCELFHKANSSSKHPLTCK